MGVLVRHRRVVAWLVLTCAAVGGVVAFAVSNISTAPRPRAVAPRPVTEPPSIRPADRRQINGTLDAFLTSAVERRNPSAAYELVTPALQAGKTRAEWAQGSIPVMPYQSSNRNAHDYRVTYVAGREVGLELLLHPAKGYDMGAIAFTVRMKEQGGRWLVDTFYPNAMFAKEGERSNIKAEPDLGPLAGTRVEERPGLSPLWIAVPLAVLGLPVVILLGALAFSAARSAAEARRRLPSDERALVDWGRLRDSDASQHGRDA